MVREMCLCVMSLLVGACSDDGFVFSTAAAGGDDGAGGDGPASVSSAASGGEASVGVGGAGGDGGDAPEPTCNDGEENGDEDGIDCGGDCGQCPPDGCAYPHQHVGCGEASLSAFCPSAERNVDGCVRRDEEITYAESIIIDSVVYDHGVGMHAPPFGGVDDSACKFLDEEMAYEEGRAKARWLLGGGYETLNAMLGLAMDSPSKPGGEVTFIVRGDGVELGASDPVDGGAAVVMEVDITGVNELELVVDSNGGSIDDRAVWADATLVPAGCP